MHARRSETGLPSQAAPHKNVSKLPNDPDWTQNTCGFKHAFSEAMESFIYSLLCPLWASAAGRPSVGTAEMERYWSNYLPDQAARQNPLANPMLANLAGLPPLCVSEPPD